MTHGPMEISFSLTPEGHLPGKTGTHESRLDQKCKSENSQPAPLEVRGQANSTLLSLCGKRERCESQFLPFLVQGVQESQKT